MGIIEILLLSVGLAMDAFAVSVCKGLAMKTVNIRKAVICGLWFGGFQALMPFIGYLLGEQFEQYVNAVAPWIAFALLVLIGGNMIREAFSKDEEEVDAGLKFKTMFVMAIATSIDALAVGITFACVEISVIPSLGGMANTLVGVLVIGLVTFFISCAGVKIGNVFGTKYKAKAEIAGGAILILLGIKILAEHLF